MKKLVFLAAVLFGFFTTINGQIEEKMEKESVVRGAIFRNGQEIEGYIKKKGIVREHTTNEEFPAPWDFQKDIRFIPKDVFENTQKLKNNMFKKYGAKNISGYRYEDMIFESVKYADMTAVGVNMIAKWMFLHSVINDKVSIFYHYNSPPSVFIGSLVQEYLNCAKENVVYRKGKDGKVKLVAEGLFGFNIEKELGDCPYVKEKNANDGYKGDRLSSRLEAINDYNQNCD